jgi:hypothetical protein
MSEAERIAFIQARRRSPVSPEELAALERRLSQRCPDCDRPEAAHWYCSGCFLPMGLADWTANPSRKSQGDARRANTHADAEIAAADLGGAKSDLLAGVTDPA